MGVLRLLLVLIFFSSTSSQMTVIYDPLFAEDFNYIQTWQDFSKTTFISSDKIDNLQNITSRHVQHDVLFSFSNKNMQLLNELVSNTNASHYGFTDSLETLKEFLHHTPNEQCVEQTAIHHQTTISLIYSLSVKGVAVISDEAPCSLSFLYPLVEELKASERNKKIRLNVQSIIHDPLNFQQLKYFFYNLRTDGIPLIVLLVRQEYLPGIFKLAEFLGLTEADQIWLIPHYYDGVVSTISPAKILTFERDQQQSGETYSNLKTLVPLMINEFTVTEKACERDYDCITSKLYRALLEHELENITQFRVIIRYRNLADETKEWISVPARIHGDTFTLEGNDIAILRSVSGDDLQRHIRVVTILDDPYVMEEYRYLDEKDWSCTKGVLCGLPIKIENETLTYSSTCCVGFVIEIFQAVMEDLNIHPELYVVEDGKYGGIENGRWNGMIGDLVDGKFDMAIAPLSITKERQEVVDFSVPYTQDQMGILVKPQVVELSFINWEFIAPLTSQLQLLLLSFIIGAIFMNYILENNIYFASFVWRERGRHGKYYSLSESMTYISGVTLQRDLGGVNPSRPGSRLAAIVFAFGMVIVVTTYTAVLAAQSVQNQEENPFLGSKDDRLRNPTENFKFATTKSTSYETFFRNGETDIVKRMGLFMEKYNFESGSEGLDLVKNGTLQAIIKDYLNLYYSLTQDRTCELKLVADTLFRFGLGFALRKGVAWKVLIDQMLLKHREQETISILQKKWFTNICEPSFFISTKSQLSINRFGGIILILVLAAALSFPLLYPEYIYSKYFHEKMKRFFERKKQPTIERKKLSFNSAGS